MTSVDSVKCQGCGHVEADHLDRGENYLRGQCFAVDHVDAGVYRDCECRAFTRQSAAPVSVSQPTVSVARAAIAYVEQINDENAHPATSTEAHAEYARLANEKWEALRAAVEEAK